MKVVQYGYSRSGTTLVCRLLMRLMKIGEGDVIVKTHYYLPHEMRHNLTVVAVRDIRDAFISHYRASFEAHHGHRPRFPIQKGELEAMLRGTVTYLEEHFWPTLKLGRCLTVKYEDFYRDIQGLMRQLCAELPVAYPDNAGQIIQHCSMERVRQLTCGLKSFKEVGPEGLHGHHINTPEPGFWKSAFAPDYQPQITEMFKPFLDHYGYETPL